MGDPASVVAVPTVSALDMLQARFCLIDLDGEFRVVDRYQIRDVLNGSRAGSVSFYKRSDGNTFMRRHLETVAAPDDPKTAIGQFWEDPGTHVYTTIAFSPKRMPPEVLNYWCGPTVQPRAGDWSRIYDFIRDVICDRDVRLFQYLLNYLAHMLQKPDEKPGVMIVLLGGQGTGKGTFFGIMRAIWSRTTLQVCDVDEVVGRFNAALERNYVVCMDEALFNGDKKSMERLKSLVTEPVCRIEQKYQPARSIDSYHRFFAASNNDHFAQVDRDDRRLVFLRVSDRRKGCSQFWKQLYGDIQDESVMAAMVADLQSRTLTGFDVRQRPTTKEHLSQKLLSLFGFDRFWFEVLQAGEFGVGQRYLGVPDRWSGRRFVATQTLRNAYKDFDRSAERFRPVQTQKVAQSLSRFCPSAKGSRRKPTGGDQTRGYELPDLAVAGREFEKAIGGSVDWGEPRALVWDPDTLEALWETYELSASYDGDGV